MNFYYNSNKNISINIQSSEVPNINRPIHMNSKYEYEYEI